MEFNLIKDFQDFRVKPIFEAYCETFPENERRNELQFEALFDNKNALIFSILNDEDLVGYFIIWKLDGFNFLEHFEIFESFRNKNLGSEVLKIIKAEYSKIILETEPEHLNIMASKRKDFYLRNGFHMISENYLQPSYGKGKSGLELLLFANFTPENIERIIENIYDVVYGK